MISVCTIPGQGNPIPSEPRLFLLKWSRRKMYSMLAIAGEACAREASGRAEVREAQGIQDTILMN